MPFEGKVEVTYTKNGNIYTDDLPEGIAEDVLEYARDWLHAHSSQIIVTGRMQYEYDDDSLIEIELINIQIPPLSLEFGEDTYVATFGLLQFTEQNNNQQGGRRRHKSRSRRAKKTAKRRLQRKHNLTRKTHRSKRKLHRK